MVKAKRSLVLLLAAAVICLGQPLQMKAQVGEPDVEVAKGWWPDMTGTWTPVGWPDHYFKYSVFYNGTILITPWPEAWPRGQKWAGEDFQLSFRSGTAAPFDIPPRPTAMRLTGDAGLGNQCWVPGHETPVLRTEYPHKDGYVLATDIFAHITSGGDVQTSLEPEYAWVRLQVLHLDGYYHPERVQMSVLLTHRFIFHQVYEPDRITPLKPLELVTSGGDVRVMTEEGAVRLSVLGAETAGGDGPRVRMDKLSDSQYNLVFDLPAKEGAYVDLLIPVLADKPENSQAEEKMTYAGALASADAYWASLRPAEEATFHVPEPYVNEAVAANLKYLPVLGEKNYQNGQYTYISSTLVYEGMWSTPGSMIFDMFLDQMGWYDMTAKYTEAFKWSQGCATAPGPSYKLHPGYFSPPRHIVAIDWLSDHGALMQQVATHALLSNDPAFIEEWTEPLVKACDFIKDMSLMEHPGVPGLLPCGYASDEAFPQQSAYNQAWNYKGLVDAVRLLRRIGHPRAEEFAQFAAAYKERFQAAYRKAAEEGDRWTDKEGRTRYQPPVFFASEGKPNLPDWMLVNYPGLPEGYTFMSDGFYLDTGPLCLVWAGLLDADDPIMVDMLDFFREGPNWALQNTSSPYEPLDRAVLVHEMSSCEPCYSWNVFHNWKKGDREKYLEGMYSMLVGSLSQKTYISCEHRHKVQGTMFSFPLAFYLAKLSVIDDQIQPGALHLLRFCPKVWVRKDDPSAFRNMPTEYGPIDLQFNLSGDGKTLQVQFSHQWHHAPAEVVLHIPPIEGLKHVSVNGKRYSVKGGPLRLPV